MNSDKNTVLERLFHQHAASLQAFFRRRIRVASSAPDLVQEVYMRMLHASNWDMIRNPELYIYTVANNLVKEQALIEKRGGFHVDIDEQAIQQQMAELPRMESELDTGSRLQRLQEVFAQLSPKCQAAVLLQYREGLTHVEIGRRLGISHNMVKKYLAQAVLHCRRRMERWR